MNTTDMTYVNYCECVFAVCTYLFEESQDGVPLKQKLQSRDQNHGDPWVNLAPNITNIKGNPSYRC